MAKIPISKKEKNKPDKSTKGKAKKEKGKKKKKAKKKKTKAQVAISFLLFVILAGLFFLMFGGELVPEKIRDMKGYSYISDLSVAAKDKLPDNVGIPKELPFELPNISFDIPNPLTKLIGDKKPPDEKTIQADLATSLGEKESKPAIQSMEIQRRSTTKKADHIYVLVELKEKEELSYAFYKIQYKKGLLGGWKFNQAVRYNVEGEKEPVAGVKNDVVINETYFKDTVPEGWKIKSMRVEDHFMDAKAGTDTVVVFMKVKTDYVIMEGTSELTYTFNETTHQWEPTGKPSKLNVSYMEPIEN